MLHSVGGLAVSRPSSADPTLLCRMARRGVPAECHYAGSTKSSVWELHNFDRDRQKKITNFLHHHRDYADEWQRLEQLVVPVHACHRESRYSAWTEEDYLDIASSYEGENEYDRATREGWQVEVAPVFARAGNEIMRTVLEHSQALMVPEGSPNEAQTLRNFITRAVHRLKKVAGRMGCCSQDIVLPARASSSRRTARSGGAAAGTSSSAACSGGGAAGASSSAARQDTSGDDDDSAASEEAALSDGDRSEQQQDPTYNEINLSQLQDAPGSLQPSTQAERPNKGKRTKASFTPGSEALPRRGRARRGRGRGRRGWC